MRCPPRRGQSRHRSSQASHTCSGVFGGPPASYSPVHEVFKLSCRLTAIFGWMPREERHPVELSQPASQPVWWSRVRVPLSRPTIFHFYRLLSDGHGFNSNNVQAMAHIFFANVGARSRHLHLRQLSVIFGRRRSAAPTFPRCQEDAVGRARPSTLVAASDMPSKITNAAGTDTLDAKRTPSVCACPSTLIAASDMPSEGHQRRQYQHPRCQEDAVGLCMPTYAHRLCPATCMLATRPALQTTCTWEPSCNMHCVHSWLGHTRVLSALLPNGCGQGRRSDARGVHRVLPQLQRLHR